MKTSPRQLTVCVLAASALLLPTAAVAGAEESDQVLTVGVDISEGWLWVAGGPEGCSISQSHDEGASAKFTTEDEPLLVEAMPGGVLELTGCGTATPVVDMPRTTARRRVRGDGAWLVGAHFARGGVYVGRPTEETFGHGSGDATCNWLAHRSVDAYDDHIGFPDREGRLTVTRRMKVIETDDDCVWRRIG